MECNNLECSAPEINDKDENEVTKLLEYFASNILYYEK
jgi:hypothetical protein